MRQHSTPEYVKATQERMLKRFNYHRDPEPVITCLKQAIKQLEDGDVDPDELVITKTISRQPGQYQQDIKNVAAVRRALGLYAHTLPPGTEVHYVVVDDSKDGIDRVNLHYEDIDDYDTGFYRDQLIRACESILSPLGWDRHDIRQELAGSRDVKLDSYV